MFNSLVAQLVIKQSRLPHVLSIWICITTQAWLHEMN